MNVALSYLLPPSPTCRHWDFKTSALCGTIRGLSTSVYELDVDVDVGWH